MCLDSRHHGVVRVTEDRVSRGRGRSVSGMQTYRLVMCSNSMRVVFSMDLTRTRFLGVIGELASFSGLKLKTAPRILFVVVGRDRTRMARAFKVASTVRTSLRSGHRGSVVGLTHQYACSLTFHALAGRSACDPASQPLQRREWRDLKSGDSAAPCRETHRESFLAISTSALRSCRDVVGSYSRFVVTRGCLS